MRADRAYGELGGHIASYASAAEIFEVDFNHFFRGRSGDFGGDHIRAAADQRTRGFLLGATAGRALPAACEPNSF